MKVKSTWVFNTKNTNQCGYVPTVVWELWQRFQSMDKGNGEELEILSIESKGLFSNACVELTLAQSITDEENTYYRVVALVGEAMC